MATPSSSTPSSAEKGAAAAAKRRTSRSPRSSSLERKNGSSSSRGDAIPPAVALSSISTVASAPALPRKPLPQGWSGRADPAPLHRTLKDLHAFLSALPLPLHRITPRLVARAIARVLAAQGLMATNIAFDVALLFWRCIINIFFRSIQPRGAWRIPQPHEGPVIFVAAPHHNQFLDPLLLASEVRRGSGRRVAFLIAEKSIKRRFIGAAARIMQSIPVARAADSAKHGQGTISLHPTDATLLQGHDTCFTQQLVVKGQIMLPKHTGNAVAEVVEVISDTEVRIKKEFKDQKALTALKGSTKLAEGEKQKGIKGTKYQCLPFVDQTQMYASVYDRLADGGSLGIFPEGGSHDRTDLLPLKAGVVIMALGAMSANPGLRVRIVPVGLSYFHPHKFRSRAVVEFGAPLDVPRELVGLFDKGGDGKRKAVGEMMDLVYDGLKSVTLRAPDYETLMFIQAGRRLYTPPGHHPSLSQVVELNRRMIVGYLKFKDDPRIVKLKADVLKYNKLLGYAGLKDHQVERATRAGWRSLSLLVYRVGLLFMWAGLALPGVVLNAPIIILAKIISAKKAKEALAASQVKLKGRDVLATWKVLVSMGLTPILYCTYAAIATALAGKSASLSPRTKLFMPFYVLTLLPAMSYSTLKFSEVGIDIYKSLPPLFVSLMPGNYKVILELQSTRARIASEIHTLIDELAPQVYENFSSQRIIAPPTSSAPPSASPGREGATIWKAKRGDKKLDGTSPLAHPLAWVDERLFGWSTKAPRRQGSTRALTAAEFSGDKVPGKPRVPGETASALPEQYSDDDEDDEEPGSSEYSSATEEEEGDYETIFRMLNPARLLGGSADDAKSPQSPRASHSRSRSGSGAGESFSQKRIRSSSDLKSMGAGAQPMTPSASRSPQVKSSALPDGAASSAQQRRQRTHSLSENVSVQDLAGAGPAQRRAPFQAASLAFETQAQAHEQSQSHDAALGFKKRPDLQDMASSEPTPQTSAPGSPKPA